MLDTHRLYFVFFFFFIDCTCFGGLDFTNTQLISAVTAFMLQTHTGILEHSGVGCFRVNSVDPDKCPIDYVYSEGGGIGIGLDELPIMPVFFPQLSCVTFRTGA